MTVLRVATWVGLWCLASMLLGVLWVLITVALDKIQFWWRKRRYDQAHPTIRAWKARRQ
jgi:hypothetical protein